MLMSPATLMDYHSQTFLRRPNSQKRNFPSNQNGNRHLANYRESPTNALIFPQAILYQPKVDQLIA